MLVAVNYHYVRPVFEYPFPGIVGITPAQFQSQLEKLGAIGVFVSQADVLAAISGKCALPDRAIMITFDDGLREQYEHAKPVLERLGIPALFFVNTDPIASETVSSVHKIHLLRATIPTGVFLEEIMSLLASECNLPPVEQYAHAATEHYKYDDGQNAQLKYLLNFILPAKIRDAVIDVMFARHFNEREISCSLYMDAAQVSDLGRSGSVGSHAHQHLPLGLLDDQELERQVTAASDQLAQWTGQIPQSLSYPYGSREASSDRAAKVATDVGIRFAFTMERAKNTCVDAPMHLARFDNNDVPGGKACRYSVEEFFEKTPTRTWFK